MRAYNQNPVHPGDVQKTAITTLFGLFEFPSMSLGLRNAAQTFQRFVDDIPLGLNVPFPPDHSRSTSNIYGLSSTCFRHKEILINQ
jgi:hypothetical protein